MQVYPTAACRDLSRASHVAAIKMVAIETGAVVGGLHDLPDDIKLAFVAGSEHHDVGRGHQALGDQRMELAPAEVDDLACGRLWQDDVQAAVVGGGEMGGVGGLHAGVRNLL